MNHPSSAPKLVPHRRFNPLTGEWVLVSPQRTQRPWLGKKEEAPSRHLLPHDPNCTLCAGNERVSGVRNPDYTGVHVFENDFPALLPGSSTEAEESEPLLRSEPVSGLCRVICFSPRHDWTLPDMPKEAVRQVVDVWAQQTEELGKDYRWVQVFENKGEIMGCSNPHPHGQIWASNYLPEEAAKEERCQKEYFLGHQSPLLLDVLKIELREQKRIVAENDHWVAIVPFWAVWPYETLLLPKRHVTRLPELTDTERDALADILKRLLSRYDNLFDISFPYSMGWHGAPSDLDDARHWQLHAHFYPPLLRSATVKKFMVGYEMMAEPQRDLTAEQAAETLRRLPDTKTIPSS
jgi:UDPglucose--hexose-1-phosphate uridylyltransferase